MRVKKSTKPTPTRNSIPVTVIQPPLPRDASFLSTLQLWGELREPVPIPDAAALLAKLCQQDAPALLKVIERAVLRSEIDCWGLDSSGTWVPELHRVLVNVTLGGGAQCFEGTMQPNGRLHIEAMAVRPADVASLLDRRGLPVPTELRQVFAPAIGTAHAEPTAPGAPSARVRLPAPAGTPQPVRRHLIGRDLLAPVIDQACSAVANPSDTAAVMAELERLARLSDKARPAPLAGVTSGGVQWLDGGTVKTLTRKALTQRLRRVGA